MILVDSIVWIDAVYGAVTTQTAAMCRFLAEKRRFAVDDLIVTEVLHGTRSERTLATTLTLPAEFDRVTICDDIAAVMAARNYRLLRSRGITIRKTIDTLVATRCIIDRLPLLYSNRDFDPFVAHLGLVSALDHPGVN